MSNPIGLLKTTSELVLVIMFAIGLIETFWGYKLFRAFIAIFGFIVGTVFFYTVLVDVDMNTSGAVIIAIVLGVIVAMLAYKLYLLGVFIQSFAYGAWIYLNVMAYSGDYSVAFDFSNLDNMKIGLLVCGVICGIVGVFLAKPFLIITSAINGAILMSKSLILLNIFGLSRVFKISLATEDIALTVIFSGIGILYQFMSTKPKQKKVSQANETTAAYYNYMRRNATENANNYDQNRATVVPQDMIAPQNGNVQNSTAQGYQQTQNPNGGSNM